MGDDFPAILPDLFGQALAELFRESPTSWASFDWNSLPEFTQWALGLLVDMGFAEVQVDQTATLEQDNFAGKFPHRIFLRMRVTGRCRDRDVDFRVKIFDILPEWMDWNGGFDGRAKTSREVKAIRLTARGESARVEWEAKGKPRIPEEWASDGKIRVTPVRIHVESFQVWSVEEDRQQMAASEPAEMGADKPKATHDTPSYVFRRQGGYWTVRFESDKETHLNDQLGAAYLAALLTTPGKTLDSISLETLGRPGGADIEAKTGGGKIDRGIEIADPKAIVDAEETLRNFEDELPHCTPGEAYEDMEEKISEIKKYLQEVRSPYSGGKRLVGNSARSRQARVRQAIKRVLKIIGTPSNGMPSLASHLQKTLKIDGDSFLYEVSSPPVMWSV